MKNNNYLDWLDYLDPLAEKLDDVVDSCVEFLRDNEFLDSLSDNDKFIAFTTIAGGFSFAVGGFAYYIWLFVPVAPQKIFALFMGWLGLGVLGAGLCYILFKYSQTRNGENND